MSGAATDAQKDAYKQAREWIDEAIAMIRPGVRSDQVAACWPTADEIGFTSEMEAFGLEFGHGLGLGLHERPIISRLNSMDDPMEIKAGMVFALETYCPANGRHLRRAYRGGDRGHRQGLPGHHALSGAGIADRQRILIGSGEPDAAHTMSMECRSGKGDAEDHADDADGRVAPDRIDAG